MVVIINDRIRVSLYRYYIVYYKGRTIMNDYQIKHYKAPATKAARARANKDWFAANPEKLKKYRADYKARADWRDIVKNTKASYYGE